VTEMLAVGVAHALDWSAVLAAAITAVGGITVGFFAASGKRREDKQALIDQLQEERDQYAALLREERAAGDARLSRMWTDKAASRQHIAELRAHIYSGSPPPPPDPPRGYIE